MAPSKQLDAIGKVRDALTTNGVLSVNDEIIEARLQKVIRDLQRSKLVPCLYLDDIKERQLHQRRPPRRRLLRILSAPASTKIKKPRRVHGHSIQSETSQGLVPRVRAEL